MSVFEIFKRTAVRRLTSFCVVLVLACAGFCGEASAQTVPPPTCNLAGAPGNTHYCTVQLAYSACVIDRDYSESTKYKNATGWKCVDETKLASKGFVCRLGSFSTCALRGYFPSATGCPSGTEWFDSLETCDKPCSARNADLSPSIKWASSGDSQCIAECKYNIASDYQTRDITATVGGNTVSAGTLHGGIWEYTGDRCPAGTPPQPQEDEKPKTECTPAANGQTYCMMPNGDACATSSSGRMICWRPSETGTKTDGPNTQTKTNGNESPNPPEGSQHTASQHVTTTTTTNSSTTTINTYTTTSGAPAGNSNQGTNVGSDGKPSGGSGTGGTGTGGDGDENSSGGGGDCGSPPVSSGDALLAQIAHQTWATRCAISDRNKQQDDQAQDLANADDGLGTVDEAGIFGEGSDITGQLSESLIGGGGGQCATGWSLMGEPIELPDGFWSLASWIGMLIVALAYLWAAVLLSES